jgi:hypothetical protein
VNSTIRIFLSQTALFVSLLLPVGAAAQEETADALPRDPASSSLLVMPTGRTLPSGTGTVGLAAPYIPYAAFSVAEHWQLSAGGVYIFEDQIGTGEAYYSYVILKNALFEDGNTSIAVGAAVMFWGQQLKRTSLAGWDHAVIPGAFAVATIGDESQALTLGMGFANMAEGFGIGFDGGIFAGIGLGYEARIDPNWKLITEHFSSILSSGTLHTVGLRYFSGRAAFDLGVIVVPNGHVDLPSGTRMPRVLPLLGISIHIG